MSHRPKQGSPFLFFSAYGQVRRRRDLLNVVQGGVWEKSLLILDLHLCDIPYHLSGAVSELGRSRLRSGRGGDAFSAYRY